jgi:uridine kinase
LAQWHTVPVGGVVVIEGVYAIRRELAELYDFRVWVHCPRETRLARGLERDGEAARDRWVNNWMAAEDLYVEAHKPYEIADLVMDGTVSGVVLNCNGKPNP